jgi:hypothetical protein
MKFLLPFLIFALVGLFALGVISRRRSKKVQEGINDASKKAESDLRARDRRMADAMATSLEWTRKSSDKTAQAGRAVRDNISDD